MSGTCRPSVRQSPPVSRRMLPKRMTLHRALLSQQRENLCCKIGCCILGQSTLSTQTRNEGIIVHTQLAGCPNHLKGPSLSTGTCCIPQNYSVCHSYVYASTVSGIPAKNTSMMITYLYCTSTVSGLVPICSFTHSRPSLFQDYKSLNSVIYLINK